MVPFGGKECVVKTSRGSISVFVCGDREKPALITYPDVALNYISCFQGLLLCPDAASLLLHNFCVYHIDALGHELLQLGADVISSDVPLLTVNDLADQVAELDFFGLKKVLCLGATAGAYILTLFAMKYSKWALGLILVSPICKAPSWTEWLYKLLSLLYKKIITFLVLCLGIWLLVCFFCHGLRLMNAQTYLSTMLLSIFGLTMPLAYMKPDSAYSKRHDLTEGLKKLHCKTIIFLGDSNPFHDESVYMSAKMGRKRRGLVEASGSLVTEEQPVIPIEFFLMGYGYYRQPHFALSSSNGLNPTPLSQSCIAPELLSPESLRIKLEPIKTRADIEI
ncbi:LOW QUALITY PROTEIN: Ndr domain-containing protein, partial [Cephalotus follicularis]